MKEYARIQSVVFKRRALLLVQGSKPLTCLEACRDRGWAGCTQREGENGVMGLKRRDLFTILRLHAGFLDSIMYLHGPGPFVTIVTAVAPANTPSAPVAHNRGFLIDGCF